jgi:transmembrane sensor
VDVLVTEGVVHVERVGRGGGDLLTLAAGERALVPPAAAASAVAVEQVDPGQVRAALAWQEPRLVFVEAPLADVVARFNERNRLQLELADPDLAARVVGGTFRPDDVETFVRLLEGGGEIAVERRGDRVVLRRR